MVPQTAGRHRIGNFIPFIEVVCDCAKVCGSHSCPCGAEQNDRDECKAGAHRQNLLSVAGALARNASPCARMTAVCGLRFVTSVRKLQCTLDRLEPWLFAQGVKKPAHLHVFQVRLLLAHCRFKPVEGAGGVAPLCVDHGVEDCTLFTLRRPCFGEHVLCIRMPAELVVCNRQAKESVEVVGRLDTF